VAAVGSYLEARSNGGKWLLRIEDIDPPREVAGSAASIIDDLQRLGLVHDGPILYQSSRRPAYELIIDQLMAKGLAYGCACTRKDLPTGGIYPGTCRKGIANGKKPRSIRFCVEGFTPEFSDGLQGRMIDDPAMSSGDFVIRRADGLVAYQLAVVVDDNYQGVTHVVRGADLLDSTSRQICLQKALGFTTPDYMHLPVARTADGKKLSKQLLADPVKHQDPAYAVEQALAFLGQDPPTGLSLGSLWDWAFSHWSSGLIARHTAIL